MGYRDLAVSRNHINWAAQYSYFADAETPGGVADGNNRAFTLCKAPNPSASLQLANNGEVQKAGADFVLDGNVITFTNAPIANANLLAFYRY